MADDNGDDDNSNGGGGTSARGFAKMVQDNPDRQRDIAASGGRASPGKFKKGDERTRQAGRKGGSASSRSNA